MPGAPGRAWLSTCLCLCLAGTAAAAAVRRARAKPQSLNVAALPDPGRTLSAPSNCSGWPESRLYLEGQAWFTKPGANIDTESSHIHAGACMPHRQQVKGEIALHILVQKHSLPNSNTKQAPVDVIVNFTTQVTSNTVVKFAVRSSALRSKTVWTCTNGDTLCKAVLPVFIPTFVGNRIYVSDGLTKMTITAVTSISDGKKDRRFETRIDTFFVVNNRGAATWPVTKALGVEQLSTTQFPWGYTHSHFTTDLPIAPIKGVFTFNTRHFIQGDAAKNSNVTGVFISVDPNFHSTGVLDFRGKLILVDSPTSDMAASCPLAGGHVDCTLKAIQLDTLQFTDGKHKLFLRTDSFVDPKSSLITSSRFNGGTFSAVTLITLSVCNSDTPCPTDQPNNSGDEGPTIPPPQPISPPPGTTWYQASTPLPAQSTVAERPYDCSGWLGPRVYLEGGTWFTRPGATLGMDSTQLHLGACLPHKQQIAGLLPLDILVQKAYFPSNANVTVNMKVAFLWQEGNVSLELTQSGNAKGWACPNNAPFCKSVYRAIVDTRPPNGLWSIPDGVSRLWLWATVKIFDGVTTRSLTARAESAIIIANNVATSVAGQSLGPSTTVRTFLPWKDSKVKLDSELPLGELAGPWQLATRHWLETGTEANVTGVFASVDPAFGLRPVNYAGYPLLNVVSPTNGYRPATPAGCTPSSGNGGALRCSLTLNPASVPTNCPFNPCAGGLCDGLHRLMLRTDSLVAPDHPMFASLPADGQVGAGTLSTVTIMPFTTKNGLAPGACPSSIQQPASLVASQLSAGPDGGFDGATVAAAKVAADAALAASAAGLLGDTLTGPGAARAVGLPASQVDAANGLFHAEAAGSAPVVEFETVGVQLAAPGGDDEL